MLLGGPVEIMQAIIGCSWTTCILFVEHCECQRLLDDHYTYYFDNGAQIICICI